MRVTACTILTSVLILLLSEYTHTQWQWIAPYPPRLTVYASAVVGSRAYFWCDENLVFSTFDGGNSFTVYPPYGTIDNVATAASPQGIGFADSLTGYLVDLAHGEFRTTDGGWTWQRVAIPSTGINLVVFGSSRVGWKFGYGGPLYKTTNAGVSWTTFSVPFRFGGTYSRVFALDENRLWLLKSYGSPPIEGSIWYSSNGGASWSRLTSALVSDTSNQVTYADMKMRSNGIGFAVGYVYRPSTNTRTAFALRTTDLGTTWTRTDFAAQTFMDVHSISDSVWVIVANTASPGSNAISQMRTTDMGATWVELQPIPPSLVYNRVLASAYIPPLNTLLLMTYDGIFRSTDGGLSYARLTSERDLYILDIAIERKPLSASRQIVVATSPYRQYLLSTDGGQTWQQKTFPYGNRIWGIRVAEETIYAILDQITLYKSTDLGTTWRYVDVPRLGALRALDVYDRNHIAVQSYPTLSVSSNGGVSWQQGPLASRFWFNELHIERPFRIVATGGFYDSNAVRGIIYSTSDGGFNWRIEDFPGEMEKIAMISSSRSFAVGNRQLYRSTDAGRVWMPIRSEVPAFCFYDTLQGVMKSVYEFYQTTDGGMTWSLSPLIKPPDRVAASTRMGASARGDLLAVGYGRLLRFPSAFRTNDSNNPSSFPEPSGAQLYQNYPNPFNPVTTIGFSVGSPSDRIPASSAGSGLVSLKVYDVLGREVATLVNEVLGEESFGQGSGFTSVVFDGSNLPSGVYYYRLTFGGFMRTKKMILLK